MPRPRTLTDEERIENKKNLNSNIVSISIDSTLRNKLNKFAKQYQSQNACIIDLIKTHPDFLIMFPVNKLTLKKN